MESVVHKTCPWAESPSSSTLCLKKVPTIKLSITLSNLNRFSKFCTSEKRMKFATKPVQHYPPHLKMLLHYLGKLKSQISCKCSADMEKCKQIALIHF